MRSTKFAGEYFQYFSNVRETFVDTVV